MFIWRISSWVVHFAWIFLQQSWYVIFVLVLLVITSSSRNELKIAQSNYECEWECLACVLIDASRTSFEAETSVGVLVSRWHVSCCKATKVEPSVIAGEADIYWDGVRHWRVHMVKEVSLWRHNEFRECLINQMQLWKIAAQLIFVVSLERAME